MNVSNLAKYRTVQVTTCSPADLLVMLYDGLVRFISEAESAMRAAELARAGDRMARARDIFDELIATLDPTTAPELCGRLESLYQFGKSQLTHANLRRDPEPLAALIRVLTPLQEAWREAARMTRE